MAQQAITFSETSSPFKHTSSHPDQNIKEILNKLNFNLRFG